MKPLFGVASVGALPLGFGVKLGLVRGKYLPAGLHAAEASYVSSSSISAFRAAADPAFHIVWSRFRMMRRYFAYCSEEEPRIFRMLDLVSRGAQGHGPVHVLLISAAELGIAWDGEEKGWVRFSLPPLRMMTGLVQHFRSAILDAWRLSVFSRLSERKGFLGGEFADFQGSLHLLTSSHLRERDKMLLRDGFLVDFCGKKDGDGHLFWECTFSPLQHVRDFPEFASLLSLDHSNWPGAFFGMVGCLDMVASVTRTPGLPPLVIWLLFILNGAKVLIRWTLLVAGLLLNIGMLMIFLWRCRIILIFGLMVQGKTSLL